MPRTFTPEFRADVVAVTRKGEAPIRQVAKDFGISETCLHRWLKQADIADGIRPDERPSETEELKEARKRIRLLEQEAEVMRRAVAYLSNNINPK